ncbi:MAG: PD40 domain-containing protein, partial [Candidatus Bipolaricaulota bacterium]
ILFVSERDGNAEIYVMNADGTAQTRITDDPAEDRDPSWSPDRTRFAFASDRGGNFDLYTMDVDGTDLVQLTDTDEDEAWPVWSPDGSAVAFIRGRVPDAWYQNDVIFVIMDQPRLYVLDLDTGEETRLGSSIQSLYAPTWSPDGSRLAYHELRSISSGGWALTAISVRIVEVATGDVETIAQSAITGQRLLFYSHPAWSPDGERIAVEYGEHRFASGRATRSLSTLSASGGDRISHARSDVDHEPTEASWAPDGRSLVYTLSTDYAFPAFIYVVGIDDASPVQITSSGLDYAPAWSD